MKFLTLYKQFLKKISRFQSTQNNWGAKPLIRHTFSVKSPLNRWNNVYLIPLVFSYFFICRERWGGGGGTKRKLLRRVKFVKILNVKV